MTQSHVAVTPGTGVLVRRGTAIFFDPTGKNTTLVSAFDTARDDVAAVRSVKQAVIDNAFRAMPFAMLSWGSRVELVAFDDCELRSSAPSVPMINGAQSRAWVEHHIEPQDLTRYGTTSIWCGEEVDPVTDLRLGIASCGGIKVTLTPEQAVAFQPEPVAAQPPAPAYPPSRAPSGTVGMPGLMTPRSTHDGFAADVLGTAEPVLCEKGHRNPVNSSACFTCGGMIRGNSASNHGQQATSEIVFPQGTVVPIDRKLRLGSQPSDPGDGTLPITIHHDDVSADHAEISVDGWAVVLVDLGSSNGTYVFAPGANAPTRLRANQTHVLEDGTSVQLGVAAASFTYRDSVDDHDT